MGAVLPFPLKQSPFRKAGMGWVYEPEGQGIRFSTDYVKRRGDEFTGFLRIVSTAPGRPSHLHGASHNFASFATRKSLAVELERRAPGIAWRDYLETFCVSVCDHEQEGEPFVEVGNLATQARQSDQVAGLIPFGASTWLYGEPGTCKSHLAAAVCVAVATGRPFLGMEVRQANVAYLDWEDTADELDYRLKALSRGLGEPPTAILYRNCRKGGPLRHQVQAITSQFDQANVGFVVVDSVGLAAGAGSDRGSAEDTALALHEALGVIGCTALCLDHIAKADAKDKKAAATAYGSQYKIAGARQSWEIRKDQADGGSTASVGLFNGKPNHTAKQRPIGLRLTWGLDDSLTLQREDVRESPELSQRVSLRSRMQFVLQRGGMTAKEIAEELDVPADRVYVELNPRRNKQAFIQVEGTGLWGLASQLS